MAEADAIPADKRVAELAKMIAGAAFMGAAMAIVTVIGRLLHLF